MNDYDPLCPNCRVDLEDTGTEVRCGRCGWTVRDADDGARYHDRAEAIANHEEGRK